MYRSKKPVENASLKCSIKINLNPLQIANHRPVSISIFMIWSWFRRMASNVGCQTNSKTTGKPCLKSHDFSIGLELKNNQKYFKVHFIIFIGYHCYSWSRKYIYSRSKIRKKYFGLQRLVNLHKKSHPTSFQKMPQHGNTVCTVNIHYYRHTSKVVHIIV